MHLSNFRYQSIAFSFFFLLVLAFAIGCQSPETPPESPFEGGRGMSPPNILLIVADDHGYADLSCTGLADDVSTPALDALAAKGVRFTQAYATSPICSPSRAGLITGSYHERQGIFWYGGPGLNDANFKTLPEVLKTKNYTTGFIGKVHYGGHDSDTTHRSFPTNHGFDYFYGYTFHRKHYLNHVDKLEAEFLRSKEKHQRRGQTMKQDAMWEMTERRDTIAPATQLFADKGCEFIRQERGQPFFLQMSFSAVHNFTHQLPEDYLRENNLQGYYDWDPATEEYYDWYQQGRYPNNPEGRAHYLGQLHYLDQAVGQLMDFLEKEGLAENTLVIYVGDNGGSTPIYANNSPLRGSKYTLYEGGIRVPMMAAFPGQFAEGEVNENVVSAMDIFPTICRAAGISPPENIDGQDLTDLLSGKNPDIHHDALVWDTGSQVAVRQGKWKYRTATKNDYATYEMVELEVGEFLHDLDADPSETTNLAADFPEKLAELKLIHSEWREGLGN